MADPPARFRLDGRVALVTGGTLGIGRAIAETYASAGAAIAVMARKQDELDATADALRARGARVVTTAGSAGDPAAIETAVQRCISELGALDILVNNAATNPVFGSIGDVEARAIRKILEVNVEGPLLLAQSAWRTWMQEHGGVIVNVVSVGGLVPAPFIGMYNVSKAALAHLTRQLALEFAPAVRVNAIAPGLVRTKMAKALVDLGEEQIAAATPLRRIGTPEDIAGAALFLASDASSWMTGDVIVIDGGARLT
ncbi:MAG: SDR family oxidoreductase [Acidimicrobiia bacterium]